MKILRKLIRVLLTLIAIPVVYLLIALVLTAIPVNTKQQDVPKTKSVYIHSNGVHLDVAVPLENVNPELLNGLVQEPNGKYLSFGWGDENFYLNTPTWGDLTFKNAFTALFLKSSSLVHYTIHSIKGDDWKEVKVTDKQLLKLNNYLNKSFQKGVHGEKIRVPQAGYGYHDFFYRANGYYSCFNTCNTWANSAFKQSELKACVWTPFDFGLLNKY